MSYNKFVDEQCEQIRLLYDEEERSTGSRTVSTERHWELFHLAHRKVFARWIAEESFSELISYFHSNYDTGQGDEFLYPLSEVLVAKKRVREVGRLWRGVISMRAASFWFYERRRKISNIQGLQAWSEKTKGQKEYTLAAMHALWSALTTLGDLEAEYLQDEIVAFEAEQRPKRKKTVDKRIVDQTVFWEIIESTRTKSESAFEFVDNIRNQLECLSPTQIRRFQKELDERIQELKSWDLWALAYIMRRGCSDDAFDYFCAWLVAQGKFAFELGRTDVARLADHLSTTEDPQLEPFLYVAGEAYEARTGAPMKPIATKPRKLRGDEWQEAELTSRYESVCSRFNYPPSRS